MRKFLLGLAVLAGLLALPAEAKTVTVSITRESNTTAYTANDAWATDDTTPAEVVATGICAARGGSGIITDVMVVSDNDPATPLQGEIWLFDTAITEPVDNAAFTFTDAQAETLVAKIPFTLLDAGANDAGAATGTNYGYSCTSASSNLIVAVKVINAYTPASAEKLTIRFKTVRND
jgi:hypothetical protein